MSALARARKGVGVAEEGVGMSTFVRVCGWGHDW